MQLKSNDNRAASCASPTSGCNDNLDLVGKMKNHLSISEETAPTNHLKVSSIDFESDSELLNSIVTIEAVQIGSNQVDAGDSTIEQCSDETDKGNCDLELHEETTNDSSASVDNGPIINSNENDGNCSQSNGAVDGGETSAPAEVNQQSCLQPSQPATQAAPTVTNIKPKPSSVKLSQTFAQVLSSKNNNSSQSAAVAQSNGNKQMSSLDSKPVPTNSYASVTQEKEETDAYHNYPDAAPSRASLNEGQLSPNSECSDVHSQVYFNTLLYAGNHAYLFCCFQDSNDSGKGSEILHADSAINGDQASSPYHAVNQSDDQIICYQFELPHYLCGRLIGANGHYINSCKQRSNTQIVVNSHYYNSEMKLCSITGLCALGTIP